MDAQDGPFTKEQTLDPYKRGIVVYAEPLAKLLSEVDPGGFISRELGVAYVDDGTGTARHIAGLAELFWTERKPEFPGSKED